MYMPLKWTPFSTVLALFFLFVLLLPGTAVSAPDSSALFGPVQVPNFDIAHHAVAADQQGFIYLAGPASSAHGVTSESYDTTYNGGVTDIFIAKFNPQDATLLAVTLVGGIGYEWCRAMMVDSKGNIVLTGSTNSPDFALNDTTGSLKTLPDQTVFVVRLDNELKHLKSIQLLGPGEGFALAESPDGSFYVTGKTDSPTFPMPGRGWDSTYNGGGSDVFIAQLADGLNNVLNVTFLGGKDFEFALALTTSEKGDVIVAGFTNSDNFPVSDKVFSKIPADRGGNGFIARFSPDLDTLQAAVKLGGNGHDVIHSLALGPDESLYATGLTLSSDFPTTSGSYNENYNGEADFFISRLSPDLDKLMASTFLGGTSRDWAFSLALQDDQGVYVAGDTESIDFPGLPGDEQKTAAKEGMGDIIVVKLNPSLTTLKKATLVNTTLNERVPAMVLGRNNQIIIAGLTNSKNFPMEAAQREEEYHLFLSYISEPPDLDRQIERP